MTHRDPLTSDLFEVPQPAAPLVGAMDYRSVVSGLVGQTLREAHRDRHEIAAECSRLSGKSVTKYMLDAYSAEGRPQFNLPLWLLPSLEHACSSYAISSWLVGVRGGRMLLGREVLTAELGKLERLRDQAQRQIRELKRVMGEMGEMG